MNRKNSFIGRQSELQILESVRSKNTASLIVIKGRRRIGKSRLAEEFGKRYRFINIAGNPPIDKEPKNYQIHSFGLQLASQLGLHPFKDNDWYDALVRLADFTKTGKVVILLDEISWMSGSDKSFLGKLKTVWDQYFSKNPELILILCGSVSSWIEKNILSSTGFVGRISSVLNLEELSLEEANLFFTDRWGAYEKFKILSVTGGVPKYLEEIDTSLTAEQNISNLCFSSHGFLYREFSQIFSDLFQSRNAIYERLLYAINNNAQTLKEISNELSIDYKSGTISSYLNDLCEAGFISKNYGYNIKSGVLSRYQQYKISDNYTNFYLNYILPNIKLIEKRLLENQDLGLLPKFNVIMGLQFENLVLNNLAKLYELLKISKESIKFAGPYFKPATKVQKGVQIDLMIATKDIIYIVEIKFQRGQIAKSVIEEVRQKVERIQAPKRMSYRTVLIHVNGVSEELEDEKYFDFIVDFSQMLGFNNLPHSGFKS
ncbi:MAG: AAA family ATPase [Rickettsiaceae bacterium]|nr:AAA family ATPase [Rickettsiaceae bacterium]